MAIEARYTDAEHTQIAVVLAEGDTLGNFAGPIEFFVGMAPGNKEHDELELLYAEGKVEIADYVAPPPPFVDEISSRQFYQQAAIEGRITEDEMVAAFGGVIPNVLLSKVNTFPTAQRIEAKALLAGAKTFKFSNPYVLQMGLLMEPPMDEAAMRTYWVEAAKLV